MFSSLAFLMKIVFLMPFSVYLVILLSARAREMIFASSSKTAVSTVILERSLPLTWMTTSAVSATRYFLSQVGHSSVASRRSSISEARCGAKGLRSLARVIRSS